MAEANGEVNGVGFGYDELKDFDELGIVPFFAINR